MKGTPLELTGKHFGEVEVLRRAGTTLDGRVLWSCFCHACQRPTTMRGAVLNGSDVRSCGCLRAGCGEANHQSKMTWERVREMRQRWREGGITKAALARMFEVSHRLVGMILRGEVWVVKPEQSA